MNHLKISTQRKRRTRSLSPSGEQLTPCLTSNQCLFRHYGRGFWGPLPLPSLSSKFPVTEQAIPSFKIITWNIEFTSPLIEERTTGILDYIQRYCLASITQSIGVPTVLLFQEVHDAAFKAIRCHPFIQAHYDLTDISTKRFRSSYGTLTCVPKNLIPFVIAVNRVPFECSRMGRDALILDLNLPHFKNTRHSFPCRSHISHIRICNTHLESLRGHGDLARPEQLRLISQLLRFADGGLVAGDMNAIAPTDDQIPSTLGMSDVWETIHPQGLAEAGYTYGYQPPRWYPPGRLDKVLFTGNLVPITIERFGVGQSIEFEGEDVWLSDHYGLLTQLTIE